MAALTADRMTPKRGISRYFEVPVAATTKIYAGSLVAVNSSGYAVPAADTASFKVVGVASKQADNSTGAAGAINVEVQSGLFEFAASSITQAMVGTVMYVVDDQTFDDALGTNGIKAGLLVRYISATSGELLVLPSGAGITNADAGATYTATEQALINALKTAINSRVL